MKQQPVRISHYFNGSPPPQPGDIALCGLVAPATTARRTPGALRCPECVWLASSPAARTSGRAADDHREAQRAIAHAHARNQNANG